MLKMLKCGKFELKYLQVDMSNKLILLFIFTVTTLPSLNFMLSSVF